ncbi:GGDEF domain-containing protein [Sinanaerobacter sp. ZZT-01]|uniref:GGDEF domain-containing protein n=1 Tax=Sinanaerobacter sp. ZZT-01 TaxID=3111540 RepID=UPI002D7A3E7A|nr:GGDEF domain-containing protein [Sinanaerobacter sp. ZZT-01]WRR92996.1 GGDEF domain-containing protein [Sinanaerobacter sp. ZZT-01]
MLNFLYAEVNIVGSMVLLLMITNWNKNSFRNLPVDQKIFNGVMLLNLLIFLLDTGMWLTDGMSLPILKSINYVVTTLYYLFNPLICLLWILYTDFKIHESKSDLLKRIWIYAIPISISTVITLVTPLTGWFFVIDENNNYMRGPWFLVMASISLLYLLCACGMSLKDIVKNGWEASKEVNLPLLIFPIGVIAAVIIQIKFFGLSIIWVCTMLACTNIYIRIQNAEIATDYLTGLYNRRRLDQHLRRKIRAKRTGCLLFAVILDLDEFKKINDIYGHMEGDCALVKTAEILRYSCKRSEDFIARLGGDEFIIVGERSNFDEIEQFIDTLYSNVAEYNKSYQSEYTLSLSMGYSVFHETDTEDSFLAAVDQKMYHCKQDHKNAQ